MRERKGEREREAGREGEREREAWEGHMWEHETYVILAAVDLVIDFIFFFLFLFRFL